MKTYNEIKTRIVQLDTRITYHANNNNYHDAEVCRQEIEILRWVLGEIP